MRKAFERYLKEDEERRLLKTIAAYADIQARRDCAWMRLMRHTGVRVGTLAGLNVSDARDALASGYLDIRPEIEKTKQGNKVFVTQSTRQAIETLLKIRKEQGHDSVPTDPLIMSRNRKGMSVRSFQSRMQMWVQKAGLPHRASPHWWRHTLAKRLMNNSTARDPRGIVQAVLGHACISSTSVYTQPDREDIERAMHEVA